ncbi:Fic family protein [Rugamonas sp. CCM 8940]|uniref:Fic family protein n=1 Tax=Rugamonas sp. CCM 8940 TaxID=2765359 RepID=UPI0018F4D9FA|nr:Fic family protein [Rugamonas sp. CCM 8940]MBJ7309356.1 Fic family protein [Rugamonas sp. CCM 8940]
MDAPHFIWQQPDWPRMHYDGAVVGGEVALARRAQGVIEGKLSAIGFEQRRTLAAEAWSQEAVATAAIEGEHLSLLAVRSSVARRLGVAGQSGASVPRHIDGLLDIMDDAVNRAAVPLSHERLHGWQAALFPTGYSGINKIRVGAYREHAEPMQIVSGRIGHEKLHYEAPPSAMVPAEMAAWLDWFNHDGRGDSLVRAALAHLWFETVHPFEDGNGRVGRVIVDLLLARDSGETSRLMRISQGLLARRDDYYSELERAQRGGLDVTAWVAWFVKQVRVACEQAALIIDEAMAKGRFWRAHGEQELSPRQRKVINVILDAGPGGFEGGMSTKKYESLTGASRATASRDLSELEDWGLLLRAGNGRSTRYYPNIPDWGLRAEAADTPA